MILQVYVDDRTLEILNAISAGNGRTIEDLAECAVAEAALDEYRQRPLLLGKPKRRRAKAALLAPS